MNRKQLKPCGLDELEAVVGGASWLEQAQSAVFGEPRAVQQFGGGLAGGLTGGPNARNSLMKHYVDGKTPASKLGFELGAMGNMALGPVGKLMAAGSNNAPTGSP